MADVLVGIVMGSDSDFPLMKQAADALAEFGIGCEVRVLSAHRSPDATLAYARSAVERGIRVLIAGAGGAAHPPGGRRGGDAFAGHWRARAFAAHSGPGFVALDRPDAGGHPRGDDGDRGARNAGLMAVRILGASDEAIRAKGVAFQAKLAEGVLEKDAAIQKLVGG